MSSNSRLTLALALLFVFFSIFYGFYLEGIPYEQEAALSGWVKLAEVSWRDLVTDTFRPFSERLFVTNDAPHKVRITESLVLKALYDLSGDSMTAIFIFNLLLVLILAGLVLWFGYQWTGSVLVGFLCAAFLLTTPAYGWVIMEYGDYSPLDQILLLIYLGLFISIVDRITKGFAQAPKLKWILRFVVLWFIGMLTMRAKEPNMFLVPGLSWLMVLLNPECNLFRSDRRQKLFGFVPLVALLILLCLPLLLVRDRPPSGTFFNSDFFINQMYILFYNPSAYAGEKVCSLFSLKDTFPSTVLANFGFFLSWAILIGFLILAVRWWRTERKSKGHTQVSISLLLAVWTVMTLAFNGFYEGFYFTRYLSWSLLPFTFLVAIGFERLASLLTGKKKILFAAALILVLTVKIVGNVGHSLYMRKGLERIWVPKWMFRTEVYKNRTGSGTARLFDVSRYWYPRTDFTLAIWTFLDHHIERKLELTKDLDFYEALKRFGTVYVASDRPLQLPWQTALIKKVDSSKLSLLTSWRSKFSKKIPPTYYLYRVSL